jgi:AraC-like DNA-binding protein
MKKLELLFLDYGKTERHRLRNYHSHTFWQLEFIISGKALLELGRNTAIKLLPGDIMVVPSEIRHRFNYFNESKESWSFKFNYAHSENTYKPCLIRDDIEAALAKETLIKLAGKKIDFLKSKLAHNLIEVLIEKYYIQTSPATAAIPELQEKIRTLILKNESTYIDVAFLAGEIGYSRDYLSSVFKKKTGIPLKQFIDNERVKIAKRFLRYSDYSISEISEKMNFSDPFTFSHFFKRTTKQNPTNFRSGTLKHKKTGVFIN